MRAWFGPLAALLLAVALFVVLVGTTDTHYTAPRAAATCQDATVAAAYFDAVPANTTLDLTGRCFTITAPVHISHTTGLTVNGGTFTGAAQTGPLFLLTGNKNLTLENVTAMGAGGGGVSQEGLYGVLAEANHGLTIRGSSFSDVPGDFINLETDYVGQTGDLNTSVMVTNDTFTNAGYHGITIEAVDGATFSHDTFTGMGPDAIDLEADIYSTNIAVGEGRYRAENNIDIRQNSFSGYSSDFFANIQPQAPGVQEHNVHLTGNTIDAHAALVEIVGAPLAQTTKPYFTQGITVSGNHGSGYPNGAEAVHGGSPNPAAVEVSSVVALSITDNALPYADGICSPPASFNYQCNVPTTYAADLYGVAYGTVAGNTFDGALGILTPNSAANAYVRSCENRYGVAAAAVDAAC